MTIVSRCAGLIGACTLVLVGVGVTAQRTPADAREQAWRANNVGVAYLEQFNYAKASEQFRRALDIDDALTAARVNLAIAELYVPDLAAARREAEAVSRRPDAAPHAHYVLGLVARAENREADAIAAFRQVLEADADDVGALVNLGQLLLQQRAYAEAVTMFRRAVDLEPYNVSALYNLAVSLTRAGDRAAGAEVTTRFQALRESGYGTTYSNTYMEQGRYAEAVLSTGAETDLIVRARPALTYEAAPLPGSGAAAEDASPPVGLAAADLDRDGRTEVLLVSPDRVSIGIEGAAVVAVQGLGARGAAVADVDNDGTPDLVVHGRDGLRVLRQRTGAPRFTDVTTQAGIASRLDVHTVALVDLDHDGDLDLVAGGDTRDGAPATLEAWRNNGDGTFADISAHAFGTQTPARTRHIAATDFDLRRDIDLVVHAVDGTPRLWRNMRDGTFRDASEATGLDGLPATSTFTLGDVNKDGYTDVVVSGVSGPGAIAFGRSNNRFRVQAFELMPSAAAAALVVDVDNDGLLDVIATSADGLHVVRNVGDGWQSLSDTAVAADARAAAAKGAIVALDANDDLAIDVVTLSAGRPTLWSARGVTHPAVRVRLTGQVSNRSGVGAKVEMRAGSLWQKTETAVSSPAAAPADIVFGLGTRREVDVIRVLWPAGIVQAEVQAAEPSPGGGMTASRTVEVVELDRKPSSCPYLYTWNGERFEFVSDFLGGGEMGYQLAPGVYNTPDPEEYVRIRGDQLRPRDGRFELRVTNELEETLFLDMFSLVAVDHPADVEVHPREGLFAPPFPPFMLYAARDIRLPAAARDNDGHDVLDALREVDRRYVDRLPTLPIRGYAEPHALTLDLGDVPARGTLLLLTGWTDYAFSSDNIAASQAGYPLQPPSLEVEDADGRWHTVAPEVGVPVGRPQTIVVDLSDKFRGEGRRVRVVTSMRVYWDAARVAVRDDAVDPLVTRLAATEATLRWRGFSAIASREEPLTFVYSRVTPHSPWKQMPGRYTREGDVRPLVRDVDDRFVVARPGDELALTFDATALPTLRQGWTRTFLLHSDGFSKEMDINSASPDQAWPLPHHGMSGYPVTANEASEPEWVARYNTRVVGRQVPRLAGVAP
jgi:Tfp pilus assembly protein PilF